MDENLIRLDARLGALELLIRNLYAQRFAGQPNPLASAEQAARDIERLSRRIKVNGSEPVVNDMLASESEEFLVAMFREIVEIVRENTNPQLASDVKRAQLPSSSRDKTEWPPFLRLSPKLRRTG
jgi:hypothetical protein